MNLTNGRSAANTRTRAALVAGASVAALLGGHAFAAATDAAPTTVAGTGSEATSVEALIVTAEHNQAAAAAPTKASLDATQPESIVSHKFIEAFTPENGDYTTVLLIAPSIGGISSNGGGIGDTNKVSLRGFQDGQYNLTYDGLAIGDTNDPTHHPADYFPASLIGAAVVDRGPGAAGDLGQANYGGAIHLFSPTLSDTFNVDQKGTYGTWNTFQSVTTVQTGAIDKTGGTKALLIFDYRGSDSELSGTSGLAYDGLLKVQQPLGPKGSVTLFSSVGYTRFFQSDAALGETWNQVELYGKNFSLSKDPAAGELSDAYNNEKKNTDFEYVKLNYDFDHGVTVEDQAYTYFYSNKTISADDNTGNLYGPNTSSPKDGAYASTDVGGYNKANRYRVYGDVFRINKDFGFGTLKVGGLFEGSDTDRHNILFDLTTGQPDYSKKYISKDPALPSADGNIKTLETSSWRQYQLFADFSWRPTDRLTISPGIKYVNFTRTVGGAGDTFPGVAPLPCSIENSLQGAFTRGCIAGSNTYDKPLYFATVNYKILPTWSIYAQYATGFLIPSLSALYADALSLNNLKPTETVNYQAGTVYSQGRFTADADVYRIHADNLEVPSPDGQSYVNAGTADYAGLEGQAAYAFPLGFTVFANGSINTAKNKSADQTELNAPKWTDAVGVLYSYHRAQASLTWKEVGSQVVFYNGPAPVTTPDGVNLAANQAREIGAYSTINASVGYDFGHFKVKVAAFNLADHRSITSITGPTSADDYTFQAGRSVLLTLEAKFR
jgi:iron complex outermembrane receptor protein